MNGNFSSTQADTASSLNNAATTAQSIRRKPFSSRIVEEHEWISLDYQLVPEIYPPGFQPHFRHDLKLSKENIERICKLPIKLQHTMGQLKSENELRAHYLISKFGCGATSRVSYSADDMDMVESNPIFQECFNEEEEGVSDRINNIYHDYGSRDLNSLGEKMPSNKDLQNHIESILPETLSSKSITSSLSQCSQYDYNHSQQVNSSINENSKITILSKEELIQRASKSYTPNHSIANDNITTTPNVPKHQQLLFIRGSGTVPIFNSTTISMAQNQVHVHTFSIMPNLHESTSIRKRLMSISACIIFQGEVDFDHYQSAQVSASLGIVMKDMDGEQEGSGDCSVGTRPKVKDIGHAPYEEQIVNTKDRFGRIIIHYEELNGAIKEDASFQLSLKGYSSCDYSMSIVGSLCYDVTDVFRDEVCLYLSNKVIVQHHDACMARCRLELEALERRLLLLEDLIHDADVQHEEYENQIMELENELDRMDEEMNYSDNQDLKLLEIEFARQCRLLFIRLQVKEKIMTGIQDMRQTIENHRKAVASLKESTDTSQSLLPMLTQYIFGNGHCVLMIDVVDQILKLCTNNNHISTRSKQQRDLWSVACRTVIKWPRLFSTEEKEWASIDVILNPHLWTSDDIKQDFDLQCKQDGSTDFRNAIQPSLSSLSWSCPFSYKEILRIWHENQAESLTSSDEKHCRMILDRFNGKFWESTLSNDHEYSIQSQDKEHDDSRATQVFRERCWELLTEINRVKSTEESQIASSVLHTYTQIFPKDVLWSDLENEIDSLIIKDILHLESSHPILVNHKNLDHNHSKDDDSSNSYLSDFGDSLPTRTHLIDGFQEGQKRRKLFMDDSTALQTSRLSVKDSLSSEICLACKTPKCQWNSFLDDDQNADLDRRRAAISDEIIHIHKNPKLKFFGETTQYERSELLKHLAAKIDIIDRTIKLNLIDKDLHDAYSTTKKLITIRSLHNYETLMKTEEATLALEKEHNRLVAATTSNEIISGILDWMHNGWYFGECDSIPLGSNPEFNSKGESMDVDGNSDQSSYVITKACLSSTNPSMNSNEVELKLTKQNDTSEKSLRMGLFCVTYMYFRALYMFRKNRVSLSMDAFTKSEKKRTHESWKLAQEKENLRRRKQLALEANKKAEIGESRIQSRLEKERIQKMKLVKDDHRKRQKRTRSIVAIQSFYRGHLGRKAAKRWLSTRKDYLALNALCNACAIAISRVWRGHAARLRVRWLRKEMAKFILSIRTKEAEQDEEEYWSNKKFQRFSRMMQRKKSKEQIGR